MTERYISPYLCYLVSEHCLPFRYCRISARLRIILMRTNGKPLFEQRASAVVRESLVAYGCLAHRSSHTVTAIDRADKSGLLLLAATKALTGQIFRKPLNTRFLYAIKQYQAKKKKTGIVFFLLCFLCVLFAGLFEPAIGTYCLLVFHGHSMFVLLIFVLRPSIKKQYVTFIWRWLFLKGRVNIF